MSEGPTVTVIRYAECRGCVHLHSEYYCVEDGNDVDSGYTHSCAHPTNPGRSIGYMTRTPAWCPVEGVARMVEGER
jgi:hypothetical protein